MLTKVESILLKSQQIDKMTYVAFIGGTSVGASNCMVMFAKFKIVTPKSVFMMPEASVGQINDTYMLSFLPEFDPKHVAKTLYLSIV